MSSRKAGEKRIAAEQGSIQSFFGQSLGWKALHKKEIVWAGKPIVEVARRPWGGHVEAEHEVLGFLVRRKEVGLESPMRREIVWAGKPMGRPCGGRI